MSWWKEFAGAIEPDAPLAGMTWFRLGGRARYLYRPPGIAQLAALLARAKDEGIAVHVLGCGANVLVSDAGFDGIVVRLNAPEFRRQGWQGTEVTLGAGVDLMPFARKCSALGLAGLECLAGIPASIGGAVRMNAGGRSGDIGRVVRRVEVLGLDGALESWPHERVEFGYRETALGDDHIVLSACIELVQDDPSRVKRRFDECFEYKQRSQPLGDKSAGCIFKNPEGLSAGALIDRAGLKGTSCGHVSVSRHHANFIVTGRGATATDVMRLIDQIRDRVRRLFDIELQLEVEIWGPERERMAA